MKVFCKCGEFLYSELPRGGEKHDGLCALCWRKESIGTRTKALLEDSPSGDFWSWGQKYRLITRKMRGG